MDEIQRLYSLPLEDFTAERNALAKKLRSAGDRDEAARVAKLKKPSAPVWAINQVARAENAKIEQLFAAGEQLRDAQRTLLRGGDASAMREAQLEERELVAELTEDAARLLGDSVTAAFRERIADTLSAIAVDPDLHEKLTTGTLDEEHRRVGFGEVPDLKLVPPLPKGKSRAAERAANEKREAEKRRKEAEARAERLNRQAGDLEEEADDLEKQAERLRRKAKTLREQADAALRTH